MKILLVSFLFPPYNAIGAVRVGKFAKFLVANGDEVRVLAAEDANLPTQLPLEVPQELVTYTPWINMNRIPLALIGRFEDQVRRGEARRGRIVEGVGKAFRATVNFPDGQIGWLPYAIRAGMKIIGEWQPDLIFASGMPFTSFIVAAHLSRKSRIPWVAEYRDLWTDSHYYDQPWWRKGFEARLERRTVSSAEGLVTVSAPLAESLSRFEKPTSVILNGFDAADFPIQRPDDVDDDDVLRIVYTGLIYQGQRDPTPLFKAMALLDPGYRRRVRVHFYGRMLPEVMVLARRFGIEDMVRCFDPVPYMESLKLQRGADVLLLLLWNDPREHGVFTGKLFEYLGARRPILAAGLEAGVAADLIRQRNAGVVSNDPDQIAETLVRWCNEKDRTGRLDDLPATALSGLSRIEQFGLLREFLAHRAVRYRYPVLVVVPKLGIGGTEQHLVSVLPRLDRTRYQIEVFALAGGGKLEEAMVKAGIPVHSPPAWASGWIRRLCAAILLIGHMWRARPGITHLFLPEAYFIGGLVGLALRCQNLIMSRRSLNVYQRKYPFLRRLEHWLHRRMSRVMGNSQAVMEELQQEGVPATSLRLVRNAVDLSRFESLPLRDEARLNLGLPLDACVIAIVANLIPYKGHSDLLRALAVAADRLPRNWCLVSAGRDDGIEADLKQMAVDLGLSERIRWLGEQRDVGVVFRAADVGVLCSHEEGSPNSVIEGMALGIPMIVTEVGGALELCRDGINAITVPPRQPSKLADAVVRLTNNADLQKSIGEAAKSYVLQNLSLDRCIEGYAAVYSELVGKPAGRPAVEPHARGAQSA